MLIALSVSAAMDKYAQLALEQLPKLKGCQAHTSVMVSSVDMKQFKKLSIQATFESKYEKKLYFLEKKLYNTVFKKAEIIHTRRQLWQ